MKSRFKLALAFCTLLASAVGPATNARADQTGANWSGCYGVASAGYSSSNTAFEEWIPYSGVVRLDGFGANGAIGGVGLGCDAQLQRFVIGVFGDFTWHADSEASQSVSGFGNVFAFSVDREWSVGGRAGFLATPDLLLYALVAYGRADLSDIEIPFGRISTPGFQGIVWGAGIEAPLARGWFIRGEYRFANYGEETVLDYGYPNVSVEPETQSGRVGIIYRFDFHELADRK